MLESRPEDALVKLVKTVETVETASVIFVHIELSLFYVRTNTNTCRNGT